MDDMNSVKSRIYSLNNQNEIFTKEYEVIKTTNINGRIVTIKGAVKYNIYSDGKFVCTYIKTTDYFLKEVDITAYI